MISLPYDRSQKRLKGLWEMRYNNEDISITMHPICLYDFTTDSWVWHSDIGPRQEQIGMEQDPEAFLLFKRTLEQLAEKYPNPNYAPYELPYLKIAKGGGF